MEEKYDVVVVGGGAAGLNGALMLARSRRSVLVVDGGLPRNAPADGVHGLLGHDGVPPAELLAKGREEVRRYGGEVVEAEVTGADAGDHGFTVALADGRTVAARRLLVTTGLVDELPDVAGLRERWGKDVVHCPYCHGWEVRDQPIGVLASSPLAMHQVLLFRQLSHDVVLFTNGMDFDADQREQLLALAVGVVDGEVSEVEVRDDRIVGVRLADGRTVPRRVVVTTTRMVARAGFLASLGLTTVPHASGHGRARGRRRHRPHRRPRRLGRGQRHRPLGPGRRGRRGGSAGRRPDQLGPRPGGRQAGSRGLPNLTRSRLT